MSIARRGIELAEEIVAGTMLAVIFLIVLADIANRTATGRSIIWVGEISLILFVWAVLVGGGAAIRQTALISIDALFLVLNAKLQAVLSAIVLVVVGGILSVLMIYGFEFTSTHGRTTLPLTGLPSVWMYAAVPVGAGVMLIRTVQVYGGLIRRLWFQAERVETSLMVDESVVRAGAQDAGADEGCADRNDDDPGCNDPENEGN